MKTIFIPIFQGHQSRNILRTGVFELLKKEKDLRIVIFTKKIKEEYYKNNFSGDNVFVEGIDLPATSWFENFFLSLNLISIDTQTIKLRELKAYKQGGGYLIYLSKRIFTKIIGNSLILQKFVRLIDYFIFYSVSLETYFEKYKPSIIFSTNIVSRFDVLFLKTARRLNVLSVSMVSSWDNLSSRGMIRSFSDYLLVHNEFIKNDAVKYNHYPIDRIIVVGMPQLDSYINEKRSSQEDFYKRVGIPLGKKILLFCPAGSRMHKTEYNILNLLDSAIKNNLIDFPAHILVRQPPNDIMLNSQLIKSKNISFGYSVIKKFKTKDVNDWEWTNDDVVFLADSVFYSEMMIGYASSMSIDAAAFDKPIINVNFECPEAIKKHERYSWFYYRTSHYSSLIKSGGINMSNNEGELIGAINKYFHHPELDRAGRLRIISEQCWRLDGKSSQRLVSTLINFIK